MARGLCSSGTAATGSAMCTSARGASASHAGLLRRPSSRRSMRDSAGSEHEPVAAATAAAVGGRDPADGASLALRDEVVALLRRLVACDTSNPPGRETQAAAILEEHLGAAGIARERVAEDPAPPNPLARLPGPGTGPPPPVLGPPPVPQAPPPACGGRPFARLV